MATASSAKGDDDDGRSIAEHNVIGVNCKAAAGDRLVHIRGMMGDEIGQGSRAGAECWQAQFGNVHAAAHAVIEHHASDLPVNQALPSPSNPPSGCRFRTRCWKATDLCAKEEPALISRVATQLCSRPATTASSISRLADVRFGQLWFGLG